MTKKEDRSHREPFMNPLRGAPISSTVNDLVGIVARKPVCFPKKAVEDAMTAEAERLGKDLSADWYSCFDLMKKHGLGKTQVRRFAMTHGVRMRKMYNRRMYYLKADWDAARKEAEEKSASTKRGR